MRAVDTNVLLRLLVRDDPRPLASAEKFVGAGAWVSHLVLAETVWVLDAVYDRKPALRRFLARPSLGFSDCLILEIARKTGHVPLGTFDRTLGSQDGAECLQ